MSVLTRYGIVDYRSPGDGIGHNGFVVADNGVVDGAVVHLAAIDTLGFVPGDDTRVVGLLDNREVTHLGRTGVTGHYQDGSRVALLPVGIGIYLVGILTLHRMGIDPAGYQRGTHLFGGVDRFGRTVTVDLHLVDTTQYIASDGIDRSVEVDLYLQRLVVGGNSTQAVRLHGGIGRPVVVDRERVDGHLRAHEAVVEADTYAEGSVLGAMIYPSISLPSPGSMV